MVDRQKDGKDAATLRETKLAQALRANLRRRKATGSAVATPKPQETSTD
jgi:hypothetical protein